MGCPQSKPAEAFRAPGRSEDPVEVKVVPDTKGLPQPEVLPPLSYVAGGGNQDSDATGNWRDRPRPEQAATQAVIDKLLPGGKAPDNVKFWLDLPATSSTKGMKPQAEAVNEWLYETLKQCHLDRVLKKEVRNLLSKERYACNLLFLGQFNSLQEEMHEHLKGLGKELAVLYDAESLGSKFSDEELSDYITVNPEFDHKNVTQALLIPGLEDPQFFNYDTPETMDEEVALHVLMMVTIAVDPHYQSSIKKIAAPFVKGIVNGFQSAPPKSFSRAHNKTSSPDDYRFKSKPRSQHNIDVSRNLVSANDPQKVKDLLKALSEAHGGYAKMKNLFSLTAPDREERYNLLSIMMTVCFDAGFTFGEMIMDQEVSKKWKTYIEQGAGGEPQERWKRLTSRAKKFLMSPHLKDQPVRLLCETQILLMDYVHVRHKMHEPYRVSRAANPNSLYDDFARSAGRHDFQEDGSTLINACNRGQVSVVRNFIADGKYKVDHQNSANGCTGMYMACVNNHVDVVHALIELRCDVNIARDTGATPVYIAGERGHVDTMKLLIAAKADVNKARTDKWGPLQNAARRAYHDVTKVLIDGGADVTVSTTSSSPLKEAIDGNFIQNEMYLREAGAPEPID